ncbi:phenylalanine--tRNA ligase subunit beta [Candidatus Woesearchaeota archaeon]|nr:phenylalanine--tRNA ligase subunit beta [Candidatus Woesearchaeota archaeon]
MPTISFQYKDLKNLVGDEIPIDKLAELLEYGKIELDSYDEETDEISVTAGDTNLPYLWSVEGIARLIKGLIGKEKGIPKLEVFKKPEHKLIVDKSVKNVRPFIAAFVAKGGKVDDNSIKQMIDLQEKFCAGYGRKRKKVAIGVYNYKKIKFPISYKATEPESIKFIPLEYKKEMTQQEILDDHPTGKEYAWILEGMQKYPLLIDANNEVLSFPPIINSNYSGKIEMGDEELFFEATGEDLDSVLLAANIFAQAFYERGFAIESVDVEYPDKEHDKIITPFLFDETIRISLSQVRELLGLNLKEEEIKKLLGKIQYEYNKGIVKIPNYRRDIMHPVDVIEDIAIAYGYKNIEMHHMEAYTVGRTFPIVEFVDKVRELMVGAGYQELMSAILSNKEVLFEKMNVKEFSLIELKEYMSERYSVLRNWIMPVLMDVLSKNKSREYPQKVFEEGLVSVKKDEKAVDYHRIAAVSAHANADYTEARQAFDFIMKNLGVEYEVVDVEHSSFMEGRVGRAIVNDKKVAYIGEINPQVLKNFDLTVPVCGFELNLSELFEAMKK